MIKVDSHLSQEQIRALARDVENNDGAYFAVQDRFFNVFLGSNGEYIVDIYESEEDMNNDDISTDDGGGCSGCSVDAIEFMLPDRIETGNGGKNSFYDISNAKDLDDLGEMWDLDIFMGNQLKTLMSKVGNRHSGTSSLREAKKSLHYGGRRVRKEEKLSKGEIVDDYEIMAEMINELSKEDQRAVVNKLTILKTYTTKD